SVRCWGLWCRVAQALLAALRDTRLATLALAASAPGEKPTRQEETDDALGVDELARTDQVIDPVESHAFDGHRRLLVAHRAAAALLELGGEEEVGVLIAEAGRV